MGRTGSKGLMGFWADIDEDYVLRFQEWHNYEHIPERVGIPGFNAGRRYRGWTAHPCSLCSTRRTIRPCSAAKLT